MKVNPKNFFEDTPKVFVALILPVLIIYAKSLNFGFTSMDEQWMIVKDTTFLQNWSSIKTAFISSTTDLYYRPLFMISLIVDYHLGKLSPAIYHAINLAWHSLAVILLYKFLILSAVEKKAAFLFTLFFSVHPVLLHAIAWVPGRNDIMLSVFTLASLLNLKKYLDQSSIKYLGLHFLFFICALFTKESAIILPLLFFADYFVYRSERSKKIILLSTSWIALSLCWLILRNSVGGEITASSNSLTTIILNTFYGFLLFIGKTILPVQQSVLPTLKNSSLLPGIFTLAILALLVYKPGLKNKKIAFLGLFMFFILLLIPVWFGASKSGEHYEQRLYGPLVGIILFLTQVNFNLDSKSFKYAGRIILAFFLLKTFIRMDIYKNESSYVDAGLKESPDYYLFPIQKGDLLNAKHDFKNAIISYNKTLALRPDYSQGFSNRGSAYFSSGLYQEAAEDYTQAIEHSSFNKLYYLNRLSAYSKLNDAENAMKDLIVLKKCCQELIKPEVEKKITDKWIANMDALKLQLNSDRKNPKLYFKISSLYFDIEMNKEGVAFINQAILYDPSNTQYTSLKDSHKL